MLAFSNRTLAWHRKEYFPVRFALLYGHYDYCVIQQFGHPFPGIEQTEPFLAELKSLCLCAKTTPVLLMTWAKKGKPEVSAGIESAYRMLAEKLGCMLAPVGELFREINETYPDIDLYGQDHSHASAYGSYLIASTLAALLLQPADLSSLTDRSYDFRAHFFAGEYPSAEENLSAIPIVLHPESAAVIRRAVENRILHTQRNI